MLDLLKFIIKDILKNKTILGFTVFLVLISWSVFSLEDSDNKALHTLGNLVLMVIPLIAILFSTIYVYNSNEFIELLASQPLKRSMIWTSLFIGICVSLMISLILSGGISILIFTPTKLGLIIILLGAVLSVVFTSIGFLSSILFKDKARGIGMSMIIWLFFALIFDGLVLFLLFQFSDYPIEKPMTILAALSPIDISRITLLMEMDSAALMGYTGALFKKQFGSTNGAIFIALILVSWATLPYLWSLRRFMKKDI
ncbi:MAG TPA: ABC transporter permease subunit [Saprospiraceae bacterium]|nr:ABC transporter permease subunit [Saprospiraceae bacterium]